ncbi:pyridoxamine 5'-phosphate oxidase family protein [Marinifilum sp. RC60d5]|uniref:pyridoxamine 5'-phosphate oxidase family protein n=1 Tax=Marinifilum sp. RC60d5 TaxID=3458414 RepID=UPI0040369A4C
MRKKEREITDQNQLLEILTKSKVCRLAIHDTPYPYIVALNYGYADNALFIHCAKEGKKIDLLKANNKVGFQIDFGNELIKHAESCQWTTKYQSVVGSADVEILTNFADKTAGLDILMQQAGKMNNEYNPNYVDRILILKVNIREISGKTSL